MPVTLLLSTFLKTDWLTAKEKELSGSGLVTQILWYEWGELPSVVVLKNQFACKGRSVRIVTGDLKAS